MVALANRRTPHGALSATSADDLTRVRDALHAVGADLSDTEVRRVVELAQEQSTQDALTDTMARMRFAIQPATARAAQATENLTKSIEGEFGLLTSVEVAHTLGSTAKPTAARSLANDMRARNELLALRHLNKFVYPGFQFDTENRRVKPVVARLLTLAATHEWAPEDVVRWVCSPTTYFEDSSRPVDHFDDADTVVNIAHQAWSADW